MSPRTRNWILFAFALSLTAFRVQSGDALMYLALARDFIFGTLTATPDPYLYSLPNATLVWTHEWLSYVVFYLAWLAGGAAGLTLVKMLVLGLTFALVLRARPGRAGGWWPALWTIGVIAASFRFVERSSLFSDLGAVITVTCLAGEWRLDRRLALRLALIFATWTQLHAGFPVGLAIFALWTISRRTWSAWTVLPILSPLLNPTGWRGYLYPFRFAANEARVFRLSNFEWFPSYHPAFRFAPETIAFWVFAAVSLILIARARRPRDFAALTAAMCLALGVHAVRFIPAAAYVTLITIKPWAEFRGVRPPAIIKHLCLVVLLALAVKNFAFGYQSSSGPRRPGFGFDPAYFPRENLELIRRRPVPGRLYATQDFGASLIWANLTPVFDHGFVTDIEFYRDEVIGTLRSTEVFLRLAQKYDWSMLLVDKRGSYRNFYEILKDRPEWKIVGEDAASYLIYRLP